VAFHPKTWPQKTKSLSSLLIILLFIAPIPAGAREEDPATADTPGAGSSTPVEPVDTPRTDAAEPPTDTVDPKDVGPADDEEPDGTDEPKPSGDIDEMVVLATGRDDFLKDLSISQTSFSAAEIKALRIQNIADLAEYTPNLEINTRSAASNPTLFIRGIGLKDYNANAAGAVAVYQDGVNINSPAIQLGQLFDTEQLTVLRGPQGTVNGRNATAGAIMVNSVLPDGTFNTSGSFTYGNYNNIQAEGAIGFPIWGDVLSGRVAFTTNFRDGTTKNNCADWDPETVDSPPLTEETIRAAWVANGSPTTRQDGLSGCNGANGCRFPNVNPDPDRRETDNGLPVAEGGRPLLPDGVCVTQDPGALFFGVPGMEGEPVWIPADPPLTTLEDFQGLQHWYNDVKDYATRGTLRFQPEVLDGMDWILSFHGGQNFSDSSHLQSLRTTYTHNGGDPFYTENVQEVSEVGSIEASDGMFEGIREVPGINTSGSTAENLVPGGRGGDDIDAGFYDRDGKELLDAWGGSLRGTVDTGPVILNSITGYEWYQRSIEDEGDAIPIAAFPAFYNDSAWQVSQELRASGEGELYSWVVGGFFLYESLDSSNLFPALQGRRIEQEFSQTLTSGAGYANGGYWLLDDVYFDGGLRYIFVQKEFTIASTIVTLTGTTANAIPADTEKRTWTGITGEAVLAWEPLGDWLYYRSIDNLIAHHHHHNER